MKRKTKLIGKWAHPVLPMRDLDGRIAPLAGRPAVSMSVQKRVQHMLNDIENESRPAEEPSIKPITIKDRLDGLDELIQNLNSLTINLGTLLESVMTKNSTDIKETKASSEQCQNAQNACDISQMIASSHDKLTDIYDIISHNMKRLEL